MHIGIVKGLLDRLSSSRDELEPRAARRRHLAAHGLREREQIGGDAKGGRKSITLSLVGTNRGIEGEQWRRDRVVKRRQRRARDWEDILADLIEIEAKRTH